MSNPVPPPGGAYPPPAQGQSGYPIPGQRTPGYPSADGQPAPGFAPPAGQYPTGYPPAGGQPTPGFPPAGQPAPGFPPTGDQPAFGEFPSEKKKKSGKARLLSFLGVLVAVVVVGGLKFGLLNLLNEDKAKEAKAGDCVAATGNAPTEAGKTTEADAKVVDCNSSEAKYSVVGRIDGESNTESKSCQKFFTDEKADYFVYGSPTGKGYLLCLKAKA